jgi:hypothetical protein
VLDALGGAPLVPHAEAVRIGRMLVPRPGSTEAGLFATSAGAPARGGPASVCAVGHCTPA